MRKRSRAVVVSGPGNLEIREFPLPELGVDDGLLEVELAGVCGSDPGIFAGRLSRGPRPYPIILGHEIVGRIVQMGPEAQKRLGVREGDRVVLEYAFPCGQCESCISGRYTLCDRNFTYGSMITCKDPPYLFGGYSDYVYIHPRAMVHRIGEEIPPEVGVLICAVLGNAIRWLRQIGGVSIGHAVVIVGPGQQGLAAVAVAKESGAEPVVVIGLSQDRKRLSMAQSFGADRTVNADVEDPIKVVSELTGGRMADVVMDVSGNPRGAELALSLAGRGATIVLPGIYKGHKAHLDLDRAVFHEITLVGVYSHDFRAVRPAIQMARRARYPFGRMITHRLPLEEARHALKLAAGEVEGETPIKVVLDPKL